MDLLSHTTPLKLEDLRETLIRLEDTIIFGLVERAQFKHNSEIYTPGVTPFEDGFQGSFLDWFLKEIEQVHAKVRRYQSPDEYPFTSNLPEPILPQLEYSHILHPNNVNVNDKIKSIYTKFVVPALCEAGDDSNHGSAATRDIECLQALSRRIHYGKFVAESKFQDPKYHDKYVEMIKKGDRDAIMETLTNKAVEQKLLERLRLKVEVYGQDLGKLSGTLNGSTGAVNGNGKTNGSHSPDHHALDVEKKLRVDKKLVVDLYEKYVIPLTKEVEVEYLLARLDGPNTPKLMSNNGQS
ncbi:chorismate mutase aro7 [Mycoemilia scoparia]|uniref:Chorismate mutase n=1 Tax=Mycoemilia scoparia TaxID=417184 RepID=A0A9W8A297_9FUNG|nr:chorismate mutase aro7 [Mycoemilia scoparia]